MGIQIKQASFVRPRSDTPESNKNNKYDNFKIFEYTDVVTANQIYSLSSHDRNAINEEIHGVTTMAYKESPELIECSLLMLEEELQRLPSQYKEIYLKACKMKANTNENDEAFNAADAFDHEIEGFYADDIFSETKTYPLSFHDDPFPSCYVRTRKFKLAFLRCEFFNAPKAAMRLAKYLELAQNLFGEEALRRPLRIDDFKSAEDTTVLNDGHHQFLPFRDRSGRRVLAILDDLKLKSSLTTEGPEKKILLYLWSILLEDVDAQRNGLVVVFLPRYEDTQDPTELSTEKADDYPRKSRRKKRKSRLSEQTNVLDGRTGFATNFVPDANAAALGIRFFEAIPIRICAMHFCLPDTPYFRMVRQFTLLLLGENFRTRVKTHQGVGEEVLDSLMGYGIPVDTLPLRENKQTIKTKQFIKVRERIEAEQFDFSSSSDGSSDSVSDASTCSEVSNRSCLIECPSLNDVIFRPGKSYLSHPGNMTLRELIEQRIEEHNIANQDRKLNLTWEVINQVETKGGRFLEYSRSLGTWTELNDRSMIRRKIASYFKEFRRKIKASYEFQMSKSSIDKFGAQDDTPRRKKRKRLTCPSETLVGSIEPTVKIQ